MVLFVSEVEVKIYEDMDRAGRRHVIMTQLVFIWAPLVSSGGHHKDDLWSRIRLSGRMGQWITQLRYASSEKSLEKTEDKPIMMIPMKEEMKYQAVVTLLGCNAPTGHALATCLKMNGPYIREIRMWDSTGVRGVALDISHINTRPRITSFSEKQIVQALRRTDLVVVLGGEPGLPGDSSSDLFHRNASHLRQMMSAIITAAPQAIVAVLVPPLTSCVAYAAELQKMQGVFCPSRLFGVLALDEMRARTLSATRLGLPPGTVSVHLTGGATSETLVPVFSRATPGGGYLKEDNNDLTYLLRGMTEEVRKNHYGLGPYWSSGHAAAGFVRALAKGLVTGRETEVSAVVRTSCLFGVRYLVLPVRIGRDGIVGTSGIPVLCHSEMRNLINSLPFIMEDIKIGENMARPDVQEVSAVLNV